MISAQPMLSAFNTNKQPFEEKKAQTPYSEIQKHPYKMKNIACHFAIYSIYWQICLLKSLAASP